MKILVIENRTRTGDYLQAGLPAALMQGHDAAHDRTGGMGT